MLKFQIFLASLLCHFRAPCNVANESADTQKTPDYSRLPPLFLPHEMVDTVQSDKAHHNKVDGDHVVQQARSDKDQDPGNERNDWRDMGGSEMHDDLRRE
jgi:hypothetical protein